MSKNHHQTGLYTFLFRSVPKPERIRKLGGTVHYISKYNPSVTASISSEKQLNQIKKDPDLIEIEKELPLTLPFHRVEKVMSPYQSRKSRKSIDRQIVPWNIGRVLNGPRLNSGSGVRVGVIDTGIDLNHPDLAANIKGGVNFVTPGSPPHDLNGHGSHIAGIIGAIDNRIGVVGVAPKVHLYAIKVLNAFGNGTLLNLIKGIEWGIRNKMHILNISISGGTTIPPALARAVHAATSRGILVVAAAGNSGTASGIGDTVEVPARIPSAIAVAALNKNNARDFYSATGSVIDIAAPGTNILSTYSNKRYALLSGTSMAAAHVSGVLAILRYAYPRESGLGLKRILNRRAIDLPPKGMDRFTGVGLVQAR